MMGRMQTEGIESMKYAAIIGGEEVGAREDFEDIDPSTGQILAYVSRCGPGEVDEGIRSARETFETDWRLRSPADRGRILRTISNLIRVDSGSFAEVESRDTGKPLDQARADIMAAARYFEFYGGAVEAFHGELLPSASDLSVFERREPLGVTAHIIPWNYPMQIGARTIAPALAAGNCCVLKPAEEASLSTIKLVALAHRAGLPPGVLNIVPGFGEEAGAALASHPGINHLSFTGSPEVGVRVARAAAQNIVPVTLELGGKSPNIIFADADLDLALPVVVNSIIQNAGQTCSAGSRLLIAERIQDGFVNRLVDRFKSITIGPGIENQDLGPLISESQLERVKGFVDQGRREAKLKYGGHPPTDSRLRSGYFFVPTLFSEVPPDSSIATEEIFGPVLSVTSFATVEESIELANSTPFGLIAAVWSRDLDTAHHLSREIRAGQIFINNYGAGGGVELPFGGYKRSGFGREKGFEALYEYTQTKTVAIKHSLRN